MIDRSSQSTVGISHQLNTKSSRTTSRFGTSLCLMWLWVSNTVMQISATRTASSTTFSYDPLTKAEGNHIMAFVTDFRDMYGQGTPISQISSTLISVPIGKAWSNIYTTKSLSMESGQTWMNQPTSVMASATGIPCTMAVLHFPPFFPLDYQDWAKSPHIEFPYQPGGVRLESKTISPNIKHWNKRLHVEVHNLYGFMNTWITHNS